MVLASALAETSLVRMSRAKAAALADDQDVTDHAAVAVLGATTASELFKGLNPVGQTVNVNGVPMTVVGVLTSVGSSGSSTTDQDDQAQFGDR